MGAKMGARSYFYLSKSPIFTSQKTVDWYPGLALPGNYKFNVPKIKKTWLSILNTWSMDLDFENFKIYVSEKLVRLNHTEKN